MLSLLMLALPSTPRVNASNAAVQTYEDQIAALQAQQEELEAKISGSEKEQTDQLAYKQGLDYLVSTMSSKIAAQEALLEELDVSIKDTKKAIKEHESEIEDTTAKIRERMLTYQRTGSASYLDILLGASGIGDFLSRVETVNELLQYDKICLDNFKSEKEALENEKAELEASKELQSNTAASLEIDKQNAEYRSKQATAYIENLENDKELYEKQYKDAAAQEAALDKQLTAYLQSLSQQNSSQVVADGSYMWPLPQGQGMITCYYGETDPIGAPHYATDVYIPTGTPIYAANDGTVVKAEYHYSYGNYVIIDHGNGCATLYAHMSGLACGAGGAVSKGQVIGYVGCTGFSTANHLHFEFRVNGNKVDPLGSVPSGV